MHYRLSRYFMNVAFACIAMVQWIVSLSTVFQSFFFFSSVVITINLLFLVPWMIISYIYQVCSYIIKIMFEKKKKKRLILLLELDTMPSIQESLSRSYQAKKIQNQHNQPCTKHWS